MVIALSHWLDEIKEKFDKILDYLKIIEFNCKNNISEDFFIETDTDLDIKTLSLSNYKENNLLNINIKGIFTDKLIENSNLKLEIINLETNSLFKSFIIPTCLINKLINIKFNIY